MIEEITKEQCEPVWRGPLPWLIEKRWFRSGVVRGILIFDNADHDWSFITLWPDENRVYRGVDLGCNFKTPDEAIVALHKSMNAQPMDSPKLVL
jgi:hypothetical protein